MKTVLVKYKEFITGPSRTGSDEWVDKSEVIKVEDLTSLNDKFDIITSIDILETYKKEDSFKKHSKPHHEEFIYELLLLDKYGGVVGRNYVDKAKKRELIDTGEYHESIFKNRDFDEVKRVIFHEIKAEGYVIRDSFSVNGR